MLDEVWIVLHWQNADINKRTSISSKFKRPHKKEKKNMILKILNLFDVIQKTMKFNQKYEC